MSKMHLGIGLVSLSLLLILFFSIPDYHTFYWTHPVIFIPITAIGVFAASYGSYVLRVNLRAGSERKELVYKLLVLLGGLVFLFGFCVGFFAIIGAFFIGIGTGYWGETFYGFSDYGGMGLALQILLFGLSILSFILSQFFIGIGHQKR
jgi:hypothetical protein